MSGQSWTALPVLTPCSSCTGVACCPVNVRICHHLLCGTYAQSSVLRGYTSAGALPCCVCRITAVMQHLLGRPAMQNMILHVMLPPRGWSLLIVVEPVMPREKSRVMDGAQHVLVLLACVQGRLVSVQTRAAVQCGQLWTTPCSCSHSPSLSAWPCSTYSAASRSAPSLMQNLFHRKNSQVDLSYICCR